MTLAGRLFLLKLAAFPGETLLKDSGEEENHLLGRAAGSRSHTFGPRLRSSLWGERDICLLRVQVQRLRRLLCLETESFLHMLK